MTSTATEATPDVSGAAGTDERAVDSTIGDTTISDVRNSDVRTRDTTIGDMAHGATKTLGLDAEAPADGEAKRRPFEPRGVGAAARTNHDKQLKSAITAITTRTDKTDKDPYIYGTEETVLLDLLELREREAAERAAREAEGQTSQELDSYRGSHRRAAVLARQQDQASLLYADGGTAIPLDRVREVCHDLRQPVAAILMLASAAEMRPDVPETVRLALQEITDQAEDISIAVRQFLDDAKQGVDGLGDPRPMNVAALARESVERWRPTFQGAIDFAAADDPLHVTIDPVLFRRALGNVLSNATRAADVGGHVAVTVRRFRTGTGERAVIEVDDSGPGFGKIPSGHGLGLTVVRRTVEAAGGSVEIAEGPRGGALVRMVLPVTVKQGSLEDELTASFQGEIPLSALAEIAGDAERCEEIAEGHVLTTRFAAFPEQVQLPAAPAPAQAQFDSYATPLWAAPTAEGFADDEDEDDDEYDEEIERAEMAKAIAAAAARTVEIDLGALTGPTDGESAGADRAVAQPAVAEPAKAFDVFHAPARTPAPAAATLATATAPTAAASLAAATTANISDAEPDLAALPAPHAADRLPDAAVAAPVAAPTTAAAPAQPPASTAPAHLATSLQLASRTNLTMPTRIPVPAGVPQVATQLSLPPGGPF